MADQRTGSEGGLERRLVVSHRMKNAGGRTVVSLKIGSAMLIRHRGEHIILSTKDVLFLEA